MLPLYPLIDVAGDRRVDEAFVDRVLRLLRPGYLQLRMKEGGAEAMAANALTLRDLIRSGGHGTRLVINDRPDIAARCGAPLVHMGDSDDDTAAVKRRYPELQVGWSTHSLEDIERANGLELAYIGFGPVFETATKRTGRPVVLPLAAEAISRSRHPVVFIGGITPDNIGLLPCSNGAQAAVIGALGAFLEGGNG